MRRIFFLPLLLSLLALAVACEKEVKITGSPSPVISLNDVRALYVGAPRVLKADDMLNATYISGVVISDPANGNAPEGLVILQSLKRKLLRGIALDMGAQANSYNVGDSLVIKVADKTLERKNGVLQISNILPEDVSKISSGNKQHINLVATTFTAITRKMDVFESTLVSLKSVVVPELELGDTFSGNVVLSDWSNTLALITRPSATFAADLVPGFGDYTGIMLTSNNNEPFMMLRSENDYVGQSLEPYHPKQLYANYPEGWENASLVSTRKGGYTTGNSETYLSGEWGMPNSYTMSGGLTYKTDLFGLMMRNGAEASVVMNFNLPYGASRFKFDYGIAVSNNAADLAGLPVVMKVEYSQDSGDTWYLIGGENTVSTPNKYVFDQELDIKGPIRFRISKNNSGSRLFIDQVYVYQN